MNIARKFARTPFARFINSPPGRIIRIIVGLVLIIWGCTHLGEGCGVVFLIIGIVPLSAGSFDLCLISPLLGGPVSGKKVRLMCETDEPSAPH